MRLISTQVAAREVHEVCRVVQSRAARRPVQDLGAVGAEDGVRAAACQTLSQTRPKNTAKSIVHMRSERKLGTQGYTCGAIKLLACLYGREGRDVQEKPVFLPWIRIKRRSPPANGSASGAKNRAIYQHNKIYNSTRR